jgi:outer membrane biosynthesis protein TonB
MKPDLLREAAHALREASDDSPARPDETRARILRSLQAQRARRLTAIRFLVPLAAVFIGSVAWASATHRMPDAWYEVAQQLGLAREDAPPAPPAPPLAPAAPRAPEAETPEPPKAETPANEIVAPGPQAIAEAPKAAPNPPSPPPPADRQEASAPAAATAPATKADEAPAAEPAAAEPAAAQAPAPAPVDPHAHALYQAAHRAHFAERNPSAALTAWDAYLAAAPRGRFAVEAHYNRALCLVRLGRTDEAKRALEPFARGSFGGYRQAEAQKLLDAMGGGEP